MTTTLQNSAKDKTTLPMTQNTVFKYSCFFLFCALGLLVFTDNSFGTPHEEISRLDGIKIESIKKRITLSESELKWLKNHPKIGVRVGDWPPFMMTKNGVSGISIDYLKIISEVHGLKFNYITQKDISWPNTLKAIRERKSVDMVPVIQPTADREKYMSFSVPYQTLPWVIVTRSDADFVGGLDDLRSKVICVQERFILQKQLEQKYPDFNLKIIKSSTPTLDSLKEVATGESYATINALPVVAYFIRQYGLSNLKVAAPAKFSDLKLTMGIRSDWPELTSIISKTIQAMSQKDIAIIQNAWLSIQYERGLNPEKVKQWSLLGGGLFLTLIILFVTVNRALKRKVDQRTRDLQNELEERKRIQKHLIHSEQRYDMALRAVSDGLWDWDLKSNNVYFSPRYLEMLGYRADELPHAYETWAKLLHPDDKDYAEAVLRTYLKNFSAKDQDSFFTLEFRMKAKNGEWKWILARGKVPIVDENGTPIRLIGTHVDITERKKTEKVMVQTEKMMSVGGLAAGMAHEINNPLAGMLGAVQNIQNRIYKDIDTNFSTAEECETSLDSIRQYCDKRGISSMLENVQIAGLRASEIVHNMLQFSRKSNHNLEHHDLAVIIDKTVELAASDYNLKNDYDFRRIKIIKEYDSKVPRIFCISNELQQVFLNILKNGAEAMVTKTYKEKAPTFWIRIKKQMNHVVIEIEDNGPGMTEETRKRAFDPFYTTKEVGKGTGLGLSVSYFIITEQHNGTMEVESTFGMSTKFIIKLPIDR